VGAFKRLKMAPNASSVRVCIRLWTYLNLVCTKWHFNCSPPLSLSLPLRSLRGGVTSLCVDVIDCIKAQLVSLAGRVCGSLGVRRALGSMVVVGANVLELSDKRINEMVINIKFISPVTVHCS